MADTVYQLIPGKRLKKIANLPAVHSAQAGGACACGNEDRWNGPARVNEEPVEFEPRHLRHMDVGNQAGKARPKKEI